GGVPGPGELVDVADAGALHPVAGEQPLGGVEEPVLGVPGGHGAAPARRSEPRYDAITFGSWRTCSGVPSAMTRPSSRQYMRSEIVMISGMSCSITTMAAPSSRRTSSSSGP